MQHPVSFELCAETLEDCLAARDGGADRIELCRMLEVGGLTPPRKLLAAAIRQSRLPVHVLIRPRGGDFHYGEAAYRTMRKEIEQARQAGASGVVLGVLRQDRTVDLERTQALVQFARPLAVTFHRAFDNTPDQEQALEAVIRAGCDRVLTSGGACDVVSGAAKLAWLVSLAGSRIAVALGGGLRLANARQVARRTQAAQFHGSLPAEPAAPLTLVERVRAMVSLLREEPFN